jgi:predicted TIM-barrel fold metal-dependent hydrolase
MNRRQFVGMLGALPFAAEAALKAQGAAAGQAGRTGASVASPFPVIDTHIHIFDKTRPGMPYPATMASGGEPPQGYIALPNRYKLVVAPFGVVGAVIVEASGRVEDNFWLLDVAKDNPIIVGVVGHLNPNDASFPGSLEKLAQNKLFFGIRPREAFGGNGLRQGLDKPEFIANLKRLADADCSVDTDTPSMGTAAPENLLRLLDRIPSLRLAMDHLPGLTYRLKEFGDKAAMATYVRHLQELAKRPNVYIKLSEVVRPVNGKVSTDLATYREWLDQLWSIFGEDRIMFGSDWPQSESVEFNSYPNVIKVARDYVMSKSPAAMEKVFWKNSTKPYRWVQREPSQRKA